MITIRIGDEVRNLADASESWITQQIGRRRHGGEDVCVEVTINTSGLNLRLSTPACGGGGGGGRAPNPNEREVLDLWNTRGLNVGGFGPGSLVAFLKQLRRTLG